MKVECKNHEFWWVWLLGRNFGSQKWVWDFKFGQDLLLCCCSQSRLDHVFVWLIDLVIFHVVIHSFWFVISCNYSCNFDVIYSIWFVKIE